MLSNGMRIINKLEEWLLWVIVLEMALLSFSQVILRYIFHTAFPWGEEVLRYQMVFVTFFGASLAVKKDAHISVTVLVQTLPDRYAFYIKLLTSLTGVLFSFILCYYSTLLSLKVKGFGQLTPALSIPSYIPYLFIPIGAFFMGIRFIAQFFSFLKEKK